MYTKVSTKIIMILVTAAIVTVLSSVLQVSHAQSNANLQNVLNIHNQERGAVGVQPLTWSNSLATEAQGYADQLRSQGYVCNNSNENLNVCKRNPPYSYLPHGASNENLAWGSVGYPVNQMVQSWVNEKSSYNGGPIPSGNNPAGHYTAMVWQGTSELGCGTSSGAQIEILVCRYNPPGNMIGQMPYGQGAAQAVGDEDAGAPLEEEGAAAPLDDQGAAAPPDDGGGDDGN